MKRIIAIFTITLMCSMVILSCSKEEVDAFSTTKILSKEPGKFFYVMLTNLDINSSSSWAYNDDLSLVPKYGRLYTWNKADELKSNVYMDLPIYRKDGTIFSNHHKTAARLMTIEDVCDIIEMDNVARLPQYVFEPVYRTR